MAGKARGGNVATLLARNADVLVTMDGERRELRDAGLFARDGVLEQVGPTSELPDSADTVLDLPAYRAAGAVKCHHPSTMLREISGRSNTNLFPGAAKYRVWAAVPRTRGGGHVGCAELAISAPDRLRPCIVPDGCRVDDRAMTRPGGVRFPYHGAHVPGESKVDCPDDCVGTRTRLRDSLRYPASTTTRTQAHAADGWRRSRGCVPTT